MTLHFIHRLHVEPLAGKERGRGACAVGSSIASKLHWSVPAGVEQKYDLVGSRYTPPALPSGLFTPTATSATLTLTLATGAPVVQTISLTGAPRRGVRTETFASGKITLRLDTGLFSGSYDASKKDHRSFFGAVLQDATLDTGAGWLIEPTAISPATLAP